MLVMRKVAQVIYGSNGGKPNEFEAFWPLPDSIKAERVTYTWGSGDEIAEFRKAIEKAHGIKLE